MIRSIIILFVLLVLCLASQCVGAGPYGLEQRVAGGAFLDRKMPRLGPGVSGNWSTVIAFPKLDFKNAVGLEPVPGSSLLAVWEREGRLWTFEDSAEASSKKLVFDISDRCQGWDDCGMLGVAFHPDFVHNHYVYVWYTWVEPGSVIGNPRKRPPTRRANRNHLSRFTLDAGGVAIPNSELVLVDQDCTAIWHKGGGMFFHPKNGFLYFTVGDDENPGNAQRIDHDLFGGVFRIDIDERGGNISHAIRKQPANGHTAHYFIPTDNPFVGQENALEEFYSLGLRSPHRMTYDAASGRIFIADVGDAQREEVDIIEPTDPPGLNFQWPTIEGLRGDLTPPFIGVNKRPVIDYDHGQGNAIIGGLVYRGKMWADDLGGRYIFGDNGSGRIWALDERTTPASKTQLCLIPFGPGPNSGSNYTGLSTFGVDHQGGLYMCQMSSEGGHLYRLQRTGEPPARQPFPRLLSQTGAFTDTAKLIAAPQLIPYNVNSPLWSDGAAKLRWIALPAGAKIAYADHGDWKFPPGTVFVKHFELPIDDAHPEVHRRLETRLLVLDASGSAYGVTYKWRADNSDADLLPDSLTEPIAVKTIDGKTRTQNWYYPSQNDCMRCHTSAAGFVLGPKTRQLNGEFLYASTGVKDNQLRTWNNLGLLDPPLDESKIGGLDRSVSIRDKTATDELRIRSYIDSNCANCHRPGGVNALWDARLDTPLLAASIVNATPISRIGPAGTKIVKGGDLDHSLIYRRVTSIEPQVQMPPLARNTVDSDAVQVIGRWIKTMGPLGDLPTPWTSQDIGSASVSGDELFDHDTFTVTGSGNGIQKKSDGFHFVSRPLKGDGVVLARITTFSSGSARASAGVMIRASKEPSAPEVMVAISGDHVARLQQRIHSGEDSTEKRFSAVRAPYWIRLERKANELIGSISTDGLTWRPVGHVTIDFPNTTLVGLAIASHNDAARETAIFDHVEVRTAAAQ